MKKPAKKTKVTEPVAVPFASVKDLLEAYASRTERVFVQRLTEHEEREDKNLRDLIEKLVITGRSFDAVEARRAQERIDIEAKIVSVQQRLDVLEKSHTAGSEDIQRLRNIIEPLKDIIEVFKRQHGIGG